MRMSFVLRLSAAIEAILGIVLLIYPPIAMRLLFATDISGAAMIISRLAGVALVSLAVACWPTGNVVRSLYGLLTYNAMTTIYLFCLGLARQWTGILLWPAVALHAVLTVMMGWFCSKLLRSPEPQSIANAASQQ